MLLGDARSGKLPENLVGFGRTLRRAGLKVDSSRMATATTVLQLIGFEDKSDLSAALESVFVSEQQDRQIFRDLFDAYFKDPQLANKLLSQMLPTGEGKAAPSKKPRLKEALSPRNGYGQTSRPSGQDKEIEFDAAMTASDETRLRHADFNLLSASEYRLVERLAKDARLVIPRYRSRRTEIAKRGNHIHWGASIRQAAGSGGELISLRHRRQHKEFLPLLVLVDVSGSMERYARMLLAFLHSNLRFNRRKKLFAFGTQLTDLNACFKQSDTDKMLTEAGILISDFAGGTKLGESLNELRKNHARCFVGRRTVVLLITDGLDTGDKQQLENALQWVKLHCGKMLWLNPLLRFDAYAPLAQGAALLDRYCHAMVAVHNVSKLEALAQSLGALLKKA
jgi:uncharacterized protein